MKSKDRPPLMNHFTFFKQKKLILSLFIAAAKQSESPTNVNGPNL